MPVDVGRTLRQALLKLTAEKVRIDRQIGAIETFLRATDGRARRRPRGAVLGSRRVSARRAKRRRMSAAARKAVSARMKAYWAKRRTGKGIKKATMIRKKATAAARGE